MNNKNSLDEAVQLRDTLIRAKKRRLVPCFVLSQWGNAFVISFGVYSPIFMTFSGSLRLLGLDKNYTLSALPGKRDEVFK